MKKEQTSANLLQQCVDLAIEKKARDMVSLNLQGLTLICDYFLIMTAGNIRQAQALSDHLELSMKNIGNAPLRIEGYNDGRWILMDFGAVIVHIFQEEERSFYDLEHLWSDAEKQIYED